jgi:hypothetical protein
MYKSFCPVGAENRFVLKIALTIFLNVSVQLEERIVLLSYHSKSYIQLDDNGSGGVARVTR